MPDALGTNTWVPLAEAYPLVQGEASVFSRSLHILQKDAAFNG